MGVEVHRSLEEISIDATDTVLELIADGSLYRGDEWKHVLQKFRKHQKEYADVNYDKKLYVWEKSLTIGDVIGRIRNHSMGKLLLDISENKDLDQAVVAYEAIVAPYNYKRPKPVFTTKMLEDAKKTVADLGYMNSLRRRYANLDDISVNNVLFANVDAVSRLIGGGDLFDELARNACVSPSKFSNIGEIPVEKFINYVIPTASSIEVLLENRHQKNLVSLIATVDKDAPSMFKWDNPFSWAYKGNISDSDIKMNVAKAGGNLTTEQLFELPFEGLDEIYSELSAKLEAAPKKSLLSPRSVADVELKEKVEIIEAVFAFKAELRDKAKRAQEKSQQKQKLLDLIEKKKNQALEGLSEEELLKKLAELEDA